MIVLKIFTAYYYESHCSCCSAVEHNAVVIANTENEALGMVLNAYEKTEAGHWNIVEVDAGKPCVTDVQYNA